MSRLDDMYEQHENKILKDKPDVVEHPRHYCIHPANVECIQITEHMNFCIGNAIKYLWRAGIKNKATKIEDLRKSLWYINREIERLEKIDKES